MRRHVEHTMGLPVSLALRGRHEDDARGHAAWAEVVSTLRWVDRVFSTYRADSFVRRLERGEVALADGPPEVAEVLEIGERAREASDGAFAVWLPTRDGVRLEPSGVVKGWAVDLAAGHLADLPGTDWCLSAGGDLRCRAAADSEPWRIGVEDPRDPTHLVALVPLRDGAVATSGRAHRGDHVIDARTGEPASGLAQVTVVGTTLTDVDVAATTAYALGAAGADWLAGRGHRAVLVDDAGAVSLVEPDRTGPGQVVGSSPAA